MLPPFPHFKSLALADQKDIEQCTQKYPAYSDYNFVSLWSWNVKEAALVSTLNNNLVLKFTDYVTGEPFYSFLGHNKPNDTIAALLKLARQEGIPATLKLVPEDSLPKEEVITFSVEEDRDNFDYIYSIQQLCSYKGGDYEQQRNMKNRFTRKHKNISTKILDLTTAEDRHIIMDLNAQWGINKDEEVVNEEDAMTRLLFPDTHFDLVSVGILVDNVPVAFSVNEIINNEYAISHFAKGDNRYAGVYAYLMCATAQALAARDAKLLNYEQDLGLANLRYAKMAFRPRLFLKKFKVSEIGSSS